MSTLADTASTKTDGAFSPREVMVTLKALAGVAVSYERDRRQLRELTPDGASDAAEVASLADRRDQAFRALYGHTCRLLPCIAPGADDAVCMTLAGELLEEAEVLQAQMH